jgi:thiaminase/transcriptional activator TenA
MAAGPAEPGFCARARERVGDLWDDLLTHPFVRGMATGTLPAETYLFYVQQNLLYLPQYARAIAWGVAKSVDDAGLRAFARSLENILDVEIPQNERLRDRVAKLAASEHPHAGEMAPATLAYVSYLLATAARGGPLDIQALILPCAWSYGDIAQALRADVVEHPVYSEWFAFFGSADYASLVAGMRADIDARSAAASAADRERALGIFHDASRLEAGFWDMAFSAHHWPDLERR